MPGRFFDDRPPVLRLVAQDLPDAALLDDRVALGPQARADEEVLDIAQPRDLSVNQVFALARPEQPPSDGDFARFVGSMTVAAVPVLVVTVLFVVRGLRRQDPPASW